MNQRKFNAIFGPIAICLGLGIAYLLQSVGIADSVFSGPLIMLAVIGAYALIIIPLTSKDEEISFSSTKLKKGEKEQ